MDWFRRKGSARAVHTNHSAHSGISRSSYASNSPHDDGLLSPGVMVPSAASLRVEAGHTLPHSRERFLIPEGVAKSSTTSLLSPASVVSANPERHSVQPAEGQGAFAALQEGMLRYHTGVVDQATLTTLDPATIMDNVYKALLDMGIDAKKDGDAKLRCVRLKTNLEISSKTGPLDQGNRTVSTRNSLMWSTYQCRVCPANSICWDPQLEEAMNVFPYSQQAYGLCWQGGLVLIKPNKEPPVNHRLHSWMSRKRLSMVVRRF